MDKATAIESARAGNKISHPLFSSDEYLYWGTKGLMTEDGYKVRNDNFWVYRQEEVWNRDWYVKIVDEDESDI